MRHRRRKTIAQTGVGRTLAQMWGAANLGPINYFSAVSLGTGWVGSTNGFHVGTALFLANATHQAIFTRAYKPAAPSEGNLLYKITSTNIAFLIANAAGGLIISPQYTVVSADYAPRVLTALGVYDQPNGLVRLYVNGTQVGAGTATVGYSPAVNAYSQVGTGTADGDTMVCGLTYGASVPTAAQALAWHKAIAATQAIAPVPGVTTSHRYIVRPNSASAGLLNVYGTANLTNVVGPPTIGSETNPEFP